MHNEEEETRIERNLQVIREYLLDQFKGLELSKDKSDRPLCHWFIVTNIKSATQYILQVAWSRLSDRDNSPEYIKRQLAIGDVAKTMRLMKNGKPFMWGW